MTQFPRIPTPTTPAPKTERIAVGETRIENLSKEDKASKLAEGWRFVTVPAEDVYGYQFAGLDNNQDHFGPGTHLVPPSLADALENRLQAWHAGMVRLMQSKQDGRAQRLADKGIPLSNAEPNN